MTPKKKKQEEEISFFYLHCRGYVYSGKLMEDERNDLTLSHANSGFFFYQRDLDPWRVVFVHDVQSLLVTMNISRNK